MPDKVELYTIPGVEVFSAGTWNGDKYTTEDLDIMVDAFNETAETVRPYIKLGHDNDQTILKNSGVPAAGWINKLYRIGEKLVADFVDLPREVFQLIQNRSYRKVSSEIYWDLDFGTKKYAKFLGGVALLGAETPGVLNLADILAKFGIKDFDSLKTYANINENDVYEYSFDIESGEDPMPEKNEELIKKEYELKDLKAKLEKAESEAKKYKTDSDAKKEALEKIEKENKETKEKLYSLEEDFNKKKIESNVDKLMSDFKLPKSCKESLFHILSPEKKEYELNDKKIEKFELVKTYTESILKSLDVNFEENSDEGDRQDHSVDEDKIDKEIEKYALENEVTYGEAYSAIAKKYDLDLEKDL